MSLLFRLLLCVTLLLNGTGAAIASVHVALAAPTADISPADAPMDVDCPHAGVTGHPSPPADAPPAPVDTGCMQLCLDLSLQQAQALPVATSAHVPHGTRVTPPTRGSDAPLPGPRLPPLRPPIPA